MRTRMNIPHGQTQRLERTIGLDTLLLGSSHITPPTNLQEKPS